MINQISKNWKNLLALTLDKSQKKEQSHSRHSIQSKLARLYCEELSKVHATPDSVLVCLFLMTFIYFFLQKYHQCLYFYI